MARGALQRLEAELLQRDERDRWLVYSDPMTDTLRLRVTRETGKGLPRLQAYIDIADARSAALVLGDEQLARLIGSQVDATYQELRDRERGTRGRCMQHVRR